MKKFIKKTLALTLCLCLFICGAANSSASSIPAPITDAQWDAIWDEIGSTQSSIAMTPGSDETQMNFAWQSGSSKLAPVIILSENADLSNAVEFSGTQIYNGSTKLYTNYVTLKNLEANKTYYYKCVAAEIESAVYAFDTQDASAFKAVLFSDIHIKDDETTTPKITGKLWNNVLETVAAREENIAFLLAAGDQANYGLASEYLGLYSPLILKSLPLATAIGNHDKKDYQYRYYQNNPNSYNSMAGSLLGDEYWFRYGEILFLVMDTTNGSAYDHYNFVKSACDANPDANWRIVMYHHDLHASPWSDTMEDDMLRMIFDPIMYYFDIDLVFSGHSHLYVRSHQLEQGKIVQDTSGISELLDPKGTMYMGTSSLNHVAGTTIENTNPEAVVSYFEKEMLYNVINFESGKLNIKVCKVSDGTAIDEITINKSPENRPTTIESRISDSYTVVKLLSTIYAVIDRIYNQILLWFSYLK